MFVGFVLGSLQLKFIQSSASFSSNCLRFRFLLGKNGSYCRLPKLQNGLQAKQTLRTRNQVVAHVHVGVSQFNFFDNVVFVFRIITV